MEYTGLAYYVIFVIVVIAFVSSFFLKGDDMEGSKNFDINTGRMIRPTDNAPKEDDDFQLRDQHKRPLTDEEILKKIKEVTG